MPVRGVRYATIVIEKTRKRTFEATGARVLLHLKTDKGQHDIHHDYPSGAGRARYDPGDTHSVAC